MTADQKEFCNKVEKLRLRAKLRVAENKSIKCKLSEARSLLIEMADYLDINEKTNIISGSQFHKLMRDVLEVIR